MTNASAFAKRAVDRPRYPIVPPDNNNVPRDNRNAAVITLIKIHFCSFHRSNVLLVRAFSRVTNTYVYTLISGRNCDFSSSFHDELSERVTKGLAIPVENERPDERKGVKEEIFRKDRRRTISRAGG